MSARKSIYAITDQMCDGGVSPNAYVPKITAEIRVHFPPTWGVSEADVRAALYTAHEEALMKIREHFGDREEQGAYLSGKSGL
jgi:hypothetical protein